MPTSKELINKSVGNVLTHAEADRLLLLFSDWQVLADLATADLVLWLPTEDGRFVAAGHCRPATGATVHREDVLGHHITAARAVYLKQALETGRIWENPETRWTGSDAVSEVFVPVVYKGRAIAVVAREANLWNVRIRSSALDWFVDLADIMCGMLSRGTFPYDSSPTGANRGLPRVADGVVLLDAEGAIEQISPNAGSCLSLLGINGDLKGKVLVELVVNQLEGQSAVDEATPVVLMGRASWRTEIEAAGAVLSMRALPLSDDQGRSGAVLLVRDVSEVHRREQELLTKDATIREIHHRVKNNLQTVSSLLRLQARRSDSAEVKLALSDAERRVAAIAKVHEVLSRNAAERVEFDELVGQLVQLSAVVASSTEGVSTRLVGTFGQMGAQEASTLAVVLTELVSNAVEHGFDGGGLIEILAERQGNHLAVQVLDNGVGITPGAALSGMGTQIVRTLVRGELRGSVRWNPRETGGTQVDLVLNLEDAEADQPSVSEDW